MKKLFIVLILSIFVVNSGIVFAADNVDKFVPSRGVKMNDSSLGMKIENSIKNNQSKEKSKPIQQNSYNNYNNNYNVNNPSTTKYKSDWT